MAKIWRIIINGCYIVTEMCIQNFYPLGFQETRYAG